MNLFLPLFSYSFLFENSLRMRGTCPAQAVRPLLRGGYTVTLDNLPLRFVLQSGKGIPWYTRLISRLTRCAKLPNWLREGSLTAVVKTTLQEGFVSP